MKMKEIHEMSDLELAGVLVELSKERYNLRIQKKTAQLHNSARITTIRKDIARIRTEQTVRAKNKGAAPIKTK